MSSSRKNFTQGYQIVKADFQHCVENLFEKQYHGSKCNNPIFINILFCALCRIQSIFAACRNLAGSPDDRTVATAVLKTLPEYNRLQTLVNQTLAEQLPKNLCRKSKRLAVDLVLIPYAAKIKTANATSTAGNRTLLRIMVRIPVVRSGISRRIGSGSVLRRVIVNRTSAAFGRAHESRSCDFYILRCQC